MHCGVCGEAVAGAAMQGRSGVVVCATCVRQYGLDSFGIGAEAAYCPSCAYAYLPGWAPWYFTTGDDIRTSNRRTRSDPGPHCPVCGQEVPFEE